KAQVDIARVGRAVRDRGLVRHRVVEQLEDAATGKIDERHVDVHARVADMTAEVRPVEHSAPARLDAEEVPPEGEGLVEVGDAHADMVDACDLHAQCGGGAQLARRTNSVGSTISRGEYASALSGSRSARSKSAAATPTARLSRRTTAIGGSCTSA